MDLENISIPEKEIKFIPYNTGNSPLPLPEYGRTVQQMVDYCVMIPDKEERTACAYSIINVMRTLFPKEAAENKDNVKFWDHLNIMARFELDIDFPTEVITSDQLNPKPERLSYNKSPIRWRHYGRNLENMISVITEMEDGPEKEEQLVLVANQMKKLLLMHNPEGVDNNRIIADLNAYSNGKLQLGEEDCKLLDFQELVIGKSKNVKSRRNKR